MNESEALWVAEKKKMGYTFLQIAEVFRLTPQTIVKHLRAGTSLGAGNRSAVRKTAKVGRTSPGKHSLTATHWTKSLLLWDCQPIA